MAISDSLIWLVIAFQIKHFLCDYPLQTQWMLNKSSEQWVYPLLAHSVVRGLGTLLIVLVYDVAFWYVAIFEILAHFSIDAMKARPNLLGRFKPNEAYFWWALGFDQMLHHLTGLGLIILIT